MQPLDTGQKHNGKYVAYLRVSTDRQGKSGLGMEAQREAVKAYLNGGTWQLLGEFVEVESGKLKKRPQLEAALAVCKKEKATLVVAKLDRLYRNWAAMGALMESGVEFVCCDNPHANKFMVQILASFAEHERTLISERTAASLESVKRKIKRDGYHVTKEGKRIKALGNPNPEPAARKGRRTLIKQADDYAAKVMPVVRELERQGFRTLRDIARGLAQRGIETRRGNTNWGASQVSNLLKRRA